MIKHKRVRIQNGIVEEAPLQYIAPFTKSNGWTDIRVAEIVPAALLDSEVILQVGSVVSISKVHSSKHPGVWIYINGPFFDKSSKQVLGKTIMDGKVILPDVVGKTEERPHLYCKNGKIDIGRIDDPTGVKWAVCGYTLVHDGMYVFPVPEEKIPSDVANGYNQRMLVGIKSDGTFIPLMIDEGPDDKGMTQSQCAMYLMLLGCTKVIGLDGGGSCTETSNDPDLIDALDLKDGYHVAEVGSAPRDVHHALAFKLDKAVLFPKAKSIFGIDCATPLTAKTAKALFDAGAKYAFRYLTLDKYKWKKLTRAETDVIQKAGLKLGTVWETTAGRANEGHTAGIIDGGLALFETRIVAQPEGSVIFFAVDYDAKAPDFPAIEAYLRAAATQIPGYKIGVYGSYAVVEEMKRRGACSYFWQTYAWSGGKKSEHAQLYQYKNGTTLAGCSVDLNEAYSEECFWDAEVKEVPPVTEEFEPTKIEVHPAVVSINGKRSEALNFKGTVYVPARFVSEALGAEVKWEGTTSTVTIIPKAVK
jgi:hypothetical protein